MASNFQIFALSSLLPVVENVLEKYLKEIAARLEKLHVPYALIGGLAVIARGFVRATKDVDYLIDCPHHRAPLLTQSLKESGLQATFAKGGFDDPVVGVIRVQFATAEETILCDILFTSRVWQAEAVRNATLFQVGDLQVPVVRAEDLFLMKLYAGVRRICQTWLNFSNCKTIASAGAGKTAPPKSAARECMSGA